MTKPITIQKYILPITLILLMIALGFLRDFVFVNVNAHLHHLYYQTETSSLASWLGFLKPLSYSQLYYSKFLLTIGFMLMYLFLSAAIVYQLYKKITVVKWTVATFAGAFVIAGAFYVGGWLFDDLPTGYKFARIIMGFVQSPFMLMILVPAFRLLEMGNEQKEE